MLLKKRHPKTGKVKFAMDTSNLYLCFVEFGGAIQEKKKKKKLPIFFWITLLKLTGEKKSKVLASFFKKISSKILINWKLATD